MPIHYPLGFKQHPLEDAGIEMLSLFCWLYMVPADSGQRFSDGFGLKVASTLLMFREVVGKSRAYPYPYAPCMEHLPTLSYTYHKFMPNVGKYSIHSWNIWDMTSLTFWRLS